MIRVGDTVIEFTYHECCVTIFRHPSTMILLLYRCWWKEKECEHRARHVDLHLGIAPHDSHPSASYPS